MLVGLSMGEDVPPPFEGVGTDPPPSTLSEGALVFSTTGATVGTWVGRSVGEGTLVRFEGVGTDPPLPLLLVGALVFLTTGATVGVLVGL
jgi:hypothetical protein